MYGGLGAGVAATATTAGVLSLPNTGSNAVVNIAISVMAGLVVWAVVYARTQRG